MRAEQQTELMVTMLPPQPQSQILKPVLFSSAGLNTWSQRVLQQTPKHHTSCPSHFFGHDFAQPVTVCPQLLQITERYFVVLAFHTGLRRNAQPLLPAQHEDVGYRDHCLTLSNQDPTVIHR